MNKNGKETLFDILNVVLMLTVVFLTLYPSYYLLCASLSDTDRLLVHNGLLYMPMGITLGAYKLTFSYPLVASGYANTLLILLGALPLNMVLTICCAYVLASRNMKLRRFIVPFVMATMFFSGGLIPDYLNVQQLGMYNTLWAVIIPGALSVYNAIIVKTAIEGIPNSLSESAYIDGANDIYLLVRIIVPLIIPTLAVIILYYAVGHWNSWFSACIYLRDNAKLPIQAVLRAILIENQAIMSTNDVSDGEINRFAETIKYALIVVGTLPILVSYPFLQKYFVKGVMIGAVKG